MTKRRISIVLCLFLGVFIAGCGEMERITSPGTLSTYEQRALTTATERAVEQAGLDAEFLGNHALYVDVQGAGAADLGKQHVAGMIVPLIEKQGASIVLDRDKADSVLVCRIRIAGVDYKASADGKTASAQADVDLSFQRRIDGDMVDKRGIGSARIKKGVNLFFFPYEKEI